MFGATGGGAAAARRVKGWVREALALDDDVTILVSELTCKEPGCPPIETVIAVFRGPEDTTKYTVHCASADVTREEVARVVAAATRG